MPRRARFKLPGIPVHLIQRGNNRQACFFAEADYHCYLEHLAELSRQFDCVVHAYVLMTNHVHLLVTPAWSGTRAIIRGAATGSMRKARPAA